MKDLVKVLLSKPTLLNGAEAVIEIYGSSLIGGTPARDNEWHVLPRITRDSKPYSTMVRYGTTIEDLKNNIAQIYDEQYYNIEYIEV